MFNFKLIYVVIFLFNIHEIRSRISDKRLCANENCTKPISLATTKIRYSSLDSRILSFAKNVDVTVYSKSAGTNPDLWGVEINGRRGYAPKMYLHEMKVYTKDLPFLLDTELVDQQVPSINADVQKIIKANKVPEYHIVDGTTVYLASEEAINPTPTETIAQPTVKSQNTDGMNILDTDTIQTINYKETDPLEVKLNKNVKSNINLKEDELSKDDNNQEDNKSKESLVENVLQSITDWMNDKEKEHDKSILVETEENKDSFSEEIEEGEEEDDDDYDDIDDESDLEDDVEIEESDANMLETNSINRENLSDLVNKNNSESAGDVYEKKFINSVEQGSNEQSNTEEIITSGEINNENTVKSRQLLSEKGKSKDASIDEPTINKEIFKSEVPNEELKINEEITFKEKPIVDLEKKEIQENIPSDVKECVGEYCLKNENAEKVFKASTNDHQSIKGAAENAFTEIPGFELPVFHGTPNTVENDQSPDNIAANDAQVNHRNFIDDNANDNSLNTSRVQIESLVTNRDKSTENFGDNSIEENVSTNDEINERTNEENNASLPSSKVNETNKQMEEQSSKSTISNIDEQLIESQSLNDNEDKDLFIPSVEEREENEKLNFPSENNSKEPVSITEENNKKESSVSPLIKQIQHQNDKKDHSFSHTSKDNQENNSGVLSGIYTNWFGGFQNDKVDEEANGKENQNSINENMIDENQNQDHKVPSSEKDDHSFLAIVEQKSTIQSEEKFGSSQTEQTNVVSEKAAEVHEKELIPEENNLEFELSGEISNMQGILENQDTTLEEDKEKQIQALESPHILDVHDHSLSKNSVDYESCPVGESDCPVDISAIQKQLEVEEVSDSLNLDFSNLLNLLTVLGVTGLSVVVFLLGYITVDKNRKEGPLIAKINTLEKALLVAYKENALLIDKVTEIQNDTAMENDRISSQEFENLSKIHQETLVAKSSLEDQLQSLEKELENSTEVGLELNRMLSDIISSQNGSETLIANVEQLQRQLVEQQSTINSISDALNLKDTENHELQLELEIKNKKVTHLQAELDKMAMNLLKVEEDKEQIQVKLENEIIDFKNQFEKSKNSFNSTRTKLLDEINLLKTKYSEVQRNLDLKTNEYAILKENFNEIQTIKNNAEALELLLNASSMKAELQQLQRDNQSLNDLLRQEQQTKFTLEKQVEIALQETQSYKAKYEESDKEKLEALTKLEVLSNYFKEKEAQLQKELSKQESMWIEQQGEATSTIERIQYMQQELQNYKSHNELLKQEIVSQEVELKSQISVLEKKAHENWLSARQAERRLEDTKQEAAQLRNRLTLKERNFVEDKGQNRIQSSLEQNGDMALSPLHVPVESPASPPPLLYGTRDHLTTSPPLPNLPPFLPPPPGVSFIPPPIPGVPGFMPPPPPSMFSVDHRPPPLGRMSSPPLPLNSRYSPDSRYSPYDRNSPSPPYDDEYGSSLPPLHRGYSPYNNRDDRREYKRPPPARTNGRNKGATSSGSGNSNESLERINRHHSKV